MIPCNFPITNENILAIREGLNPSKMDNIYSICGGGDIPFMLIEKGAKVYAVDFDDAQINFIKKRIQNLESKNRNFDLFKSLSSTFEDLYTWIYGSNYNIRDEYFSKTGIGFFRENLDNLTIKTGDFFKLKLNFSDFNKVYVSNAFTYQGRDFKGIYPFVKKFNEGTIFYLTYFSSYRESLDKFFKKDLAKEKINISKNLSLKDCAWSVSVFQKN